MCECEELQLLSIACATNEELLDKVLNENFTDYYRNLAVVEFNKRTKHLKILKVVTTPTSDDAVEVTLQNHEIFPRA